MRLKKLSLKNFGPFKNYELKLPDEDSICVLFTGKNNEGKSSIISALKLLDGATRAINQKKQAIYISGNTVYKLLQLDTESLNIRRMIYNYEDNIAEIRGVFSDNFEIIVYLDPDDEIVYADYVGTIPYDIKETFGFVPALGPLSDESEEILTEKHLRASINTSLAPRHLRNHFYSLLSKDEFSLIRDIVNSSWQDIELLKYEISWQENKIYCFYKERRFDKERGFDREISWAGQGLQVWFQIITHLVRLRNTSILILDEPEINLHPEKQNDLIRILKEYYGGSIIIATHSIELMNNVKISHIVHVKKSQPKPKIKNTSDRLYLELVRSQVGSNFNFIASQFEEVEILIFTEDVYDFSVINELAKAYDFQRKSFNIPIHGFSEYRKALFYKDAYELLIGKKIDCSILLDRDYYPEEYLQEIKTELKRAGVKVIYTPGKEIENLFLYPSLLLDITPKENHHTLEHELDKLYKNLQTECQSNFFTLHKNFFPSGIDEKTIFKNYIPLFNEQWNDRKKRHKIIAGKLALKFLRDFFRNNYERNLSNRYLVNKLAALNLTEIKTFIKDIYQN